MKEFMQILKRYLPPYKRYLVGSVVFNILAAILNIFSFAAIIPILQILFNTGEYKTVTTLMAWDSGSLKEVMANNTSYYVNELIAMTNPVTTLLLIGLLLRPSLGKFNAWYSAKVESTKLVG